MDNSNKIVVIDGSSYLFRAFFAAPPFATSAGLKTGATYVFINMVKSLMKKHPTNKLILTFDAKGPTFRNDMYSEYKSNRPPMPEDLKHQLYFITRLITAMGIQIVSIPGVEADDVIGTIAKNASEIGFDVLISSGDKDMAQLVSDNVTVIDTMTDSYLTVPLVQEKFGVPPHFIVDFLALKGDKVDNIPGVIGIGDKAAATLIQEIGGIADIYRDVDRVLSSSIRGAKRARTLLIDQRNQAELSYSLATIKTDVPLDFSLESINIKEQNNEEFIEIAKELEFSKWLTEMGASNDDVPTFTQTETALADELDSFIGKIASDDHVGVSFFTDANNDDIYIVLTKGNESMSVIFNGSIEQKKSISSSLQVLFTSDRTGLIVSDLWKENAYYLKEINVEPHGPLASLTLLSMIKCYKFDNHSVEGIFQRELSQELPKQSKGTNASQENRQRNVLLSQFCLLSLNSIIEKHPESVDEILGQEP